MRKNGMCTGTNKKQKEKIHIDQQSYMSLITGTLSILFLISKMLLKYIRLTICPFHVRGVSQVSI